MIYVGGELRGLARAEWPPHIEVGVAQDVYLVPSLPAPREFSEALQELIPSRSLRWVPELDAWAVAWKYKDEGITLFDAFFPEAPVVDYWSGQVTEFVPREAVATIPTPEGWEY